MLPIKGTIPISILLIKSIPSSRGDTVRFRIKHISGGALMSIILSL